MNSGLIAAMDFGEEADAAGGPTAAFARRSQLAIRAAPDGGMESELGNSAGVVPVDHWNNLHTYVVPRGKHHTRTDPSSPATTSARRCTGGRQNWQSNGYGHAVSWRCSVPYCGEVERERDQARPHLAARGLKQRRWRFGAAEERQNNPPNCPPTSVLLVLKLKFYTKIFALYSRR
jgi:hypothetical protein